MIKLLYITNGIHGSGGLERVLAVKVSYLADTLGYEVHIFTLNGGYEQPFYKFSAKIKFHDIKAEGNSLNYFLSYRSGINKVLKTIQPQVISVCDDGLKGLLFPILFGKKTPVIYERHASLNLNFITNKASSLIEKVKNYCQKSIMVWGAKQFDNFIVLTNGNKKDWQGVNCTVIPNPTPFETNEIDLHIVKDKTVLAVGTQSYNKGYDRLFLSWQLVHKKHPDWKLKIYGKENLALNLQNEIDALNLQKSVVLEKPIANIEEAYKKASIYAMPSRSEGFGMVLIEAMSFGVPCISFNCPHGPADIICNGEDGFLIENGDIKGFANAIMQLIENNELRIAMGEAAKENVVRYAPNKIVALWDELFKSLIQ
jgi:glycosyltransferase involved in cell wall biosynthesis